LDGVEKGHERAGVLRRVREATNGLGDHLLKMLERADQVTGAHRANVVSLLPV